MSCEIAFSGSRDELAEHARSCDTCADVLRIRTASTNVWQTAKARDEMRATFRERRIAQRHTPLRRRSVSVVVALAFTLGAFAAFAAVRANAARIALELLPSTAPTTPTVPSVPSAAPPGSSSAAAPVEPLPEVRDESAAPLIEFAQESAAPARTATRADNDANVLWKRAMDQLDKGDRPAAEATLTQLLALQQAPRGTRERATFRLAQLQVARGDLTSSQTRLWNLVRSADATLGFDAALLLERCVPEKKRELWTAYLDLHPNGELSERARRRLTAP
jgi:hypothetical protein